MVTNTPGSVARQDPRQVSNTLRWHFNWNDPGLAAGVQIGVLPANAYIITNQLEIVTTFNGTTPLISVGTVATAYNNIMGTADNTATAASVYSPALAANKYGRGLTQAGDTPVFLKLAVTGSPSQGVGEYLLEFEGGFPG